MKFGFCRLRKFIRFIKRLCCWLPVLWKQEDWDYDYLYDLIEIKLKEIRECLDKDTLVIDSKKHVKQINICLAYLDRYRNWENYIEFPHDEIKFEKLENGCSRMITSTKTNITCKKAHAFEKFNYDMFWKRFLQWHQHWWS